MKYNDIRRMAKGLNVNTYHMKKPDVIRSIQSAEDNIPCFATDRAGNCPEGTCLWRSDCLSIFYAETKV